LKSSLDIISAYAIQHGLPHVVVKWLLNAIISPKFLDHASQNALIKCLYPEGKVSNDVVYIVVGSLGHGVLKASVPSQQGLIKWLVMIYDFLEDPAVLSRMYSVFFNLLDSLGLRAGLCCLLAKVTRKKNVKAFRLQMLQNLSRTVGPEPALLKLVAVYEKFSPGTLDLGRSKKSTSKFEHPDPEWGNQLEQIQSKAQLRSIDDGPRRDWDDPFGPPIPKAPAEAMEDGPCTFRTAKDIIDSLSKPTSPDLTISELRDPFLQTRAFLESGDATLTEVNDLLSSNLQQGLEKIEQGQKESRTISQVLDDALSFTRYCKVLFLLPGTL